MVAEMLAMQLIINQTSTTNTLPCRLNYYHQYLAKVVDEALNANHRNFLYVHLCTHHHTAQVKIVTALSMMLFCL